MTRRLFVLAGLLLSTAACHGTRAPAEERVARAERGRGDVVVAVAWPFERRHQIRFGEGLDLAADQINATGGIGGRRLRLVRFDDKESVDEGRLVAERISADPDIVAVIGHLQSYVTLPAAAIYDRAGLVLLAPVATDPTLTSSGYTRVFRVTLSEEAIGRQLADTAKRRGFRRMAIHYIRNEYGRGLANAFEQRATENGITVAVRKSYDAEDPSTADAFAPTLREWTNSELDAVFLAGEPPSAVHLLAAARQAGVTLPILGGDAMGSPELLSLAGSAAEGTVVAAFFHPDEPRPEVKAFTEAFQRRYHTTPDAGSALGYDAVTLLAHAMRQAKSSVPDRIAVALHATRQWSGVTGKFAFDPTGETIGKRVVPLVVRHGAFAYEPELPSPEITARR
jgi:branched-chain amino acid transport system substrate-binding protein